MMARKFCGCSNLLTILTSTSRRSEVRCINSWNNVLRHKAIDNKVEKLLYKNIYSQIKACGPITIAEYMKQVLTHPVEGYYMSKEVFGPQGDFITSPEISTLFGEMIGAWILNELYKITDKSVQLVELGPGRGTLSNDILRMFNHFKQSEKISLHLVEISPKLSKLQAEKICETFEEVTPEVNPEQKNAVTHYMKGVTKNGSNVFWYYSIRDVPKGFSIFLAHEFFDALPIHKFQRTNDGWCEVMIDIDTMQTEREQFRYVLVKGATPASTFFIDVNEKRNHLEVSPESLVTIDYIANYLKENGGFSLIVDYGHDGDNRDTFRAFKKHAQHNPLLQPGTADLTADVDFSMFRKIATRDDRVVCFGPVEQNLFLKRMGIDTRLQMLLEAANEHQKKIITRGYNMIMDSDKMGACFKMMSMFPAVLREHLEAWPVYGFHDIPKE